MKRLYCFVLLVAIGSFFNILPTKHTGSELILQRLTSQPIVQVKKGVTQWYERVQDIVAVLDSKGREVFGGRGVCEESPGRARRERSGGAKKVFEQCAG